MFLLLFDNANQNQCGNSYHTKERKRHREAGDRNAPVKYSVEYIA
jgi:hypothetical protein